jgi:hypothetical protein
VVGVPAAFGIDVCPLPVAVWGFDSLAILDAAAGLNPARSPSLPGVPPKLFESSCILCYQVELAQ